MSRLTIEISSEEHQKIKALAALQGKSIKDFVMQKIFSSENSEKDSWQKLRELLTARIRAAEESSVSDKSITQISQEELSPSN